MNNETNNNVFPANPYFTDNSTNQPEESALPAQQEAVQPYESPSQSGEYKTDTAYSDNTFSSLPYSQYSVPEKPLFETNGHDVLFSVLSLVSSLIFIFLGLWGGFRVGYTASYLALFFVLSTYLKRKEKTPPLYSVVCAVASLAGAFVYAVASNESVRFFLFIVMLLLSAVWFDALACDRKEIGDLGLIKNIFFSLFGNSFPNYFTSVKSLFSKKNGENRTFGKILLGILCAIPVLCVVVPLLISSDIAFEGLIDSIFDDFFLSAVKIVLSALFAPLIISFGFSLKKNEQKQCEESNFAGIENVYMISFLSVISLCYLAYLFSQLAYFFSAFKGLLPENYSFTAAEYARRGFFEMTVIAALNLILIFVVLLISKKENGLMCAASKILCTFIGVFTLFIIATAFSKMYLYINRFGMTVLRLSTSAFMVFLATVFIAVMLRLFIKKIPVLRTALISAAAVLLILGFGNVNNFVAQYNVFAWKSGKLDTIDVKTIYELGDEGIPYLIKLAKSKDETVSTNSRYYIYLACHNKYYNFTLDEEGLEYDKFQRKYTGIGGWSYTRARAYSMLDKCIKVNPELLMSTDMPEYIYTDYDDIFEEGYDGYSENEYSYTDDTDDFYEY